MSDTRYPTRMHEVLGVETGEVFTVTWNDTKMDFSLDGFGIPEDIETEDIDGLRYPASGPDVVYMVNHPERITRRPRPDPITGLVPCGCGGKAGYHYSVMRDNDCCVECGVCGGHTKVVLSEDKARDAWNTAMGWKSGAE